MKTLTHLFILLSLSTFLVAQTDSTVTETPVVPEEPVEEVVTEAADSTETTEVATDLETALEVAEMDSLSMDSSLVEETVAPAAEDSSSVAEPDMIWVQNEPAPTAIAGLLNQGNVYFWTNDALEGLDFTSLPYLSVVDPTMIAISANDCLDIVCHLLASDGHGVDYVVVFKDDSSHVQIYNTVTKVVAIEAPAGDIVAALDAYLKENAGMDYVAAPLEEPVVADTAPELEMGPSIADLAKEKSLQVRRRHFRATDKIAANPANLARNFEHDVTLNLLPDLRISIRNSVLTPGWYKKWWTVGDVWDDATKQEYLSTIENERIVFNIAPEYFSLFGFSIGNFGMNLSGRSHLKMVVPGNLLALPFQDILLNRTLDVSGFELESIPLMGKTSFSYGMPVSTPYGEVKVGVALNAYKAAGYLRVVNHEFTQVFTEDSVITTTVSEGWATQGGIEGQLDKLNTEGFDPLSTGSDLGLGLDIGAIMDLEPLVQQNVEVQVTLRNLGANYVWSDLKHETWTAISALPSSAFADTNDVEDYQVTETIVHDDDKTLTIKVPTVFNITAFYQPVTSVLIGAGLQKAFTEEVRFAMGPDLTYLFQVNYYPTKWLDLSYYHLPRYGEHTHTFGTGFHFGFLETGLTLSFFNGINSNAKGLGFGLKSSLHF